MAALAVCQPSLPRHRMSSLLALPVDLLLVPSAQPGATHRTRGCGGLGISVSPGLVLASAWRGLFQHLLPRRARRWQRDIMAVEPCAIHHPLWLQASGLLASPGCQGAYQLAVRTSEVPVMLSVPLAELRSHLRETTMQRACVDAPMRQLLLVLNFVLL